MFHRPRLLSFVPMALAISLFVFAGQAVAGTPVQAGAAESESNLLALTWQPAFCEYRPEKPECMRLNAGGLPDAEKRLSLHGLWPQPRGKDYCGVPANLVSIDKQGRWGDLPAPEMDAMTETALEAAMPGMASQLHRHEWIKHGTCYFAAGGADEYYDDALHLMAVINETVFGDFLADRIGKEVSVAAIRERFDAAFGSGAGARVSVTCRQDGPRVLIQEIRVNLRGLISPEASVSDLIHAAAPVTAGCTRGVIDPAGLQ